MTIPTPALNDLRFMGSTGLSAFLFGFQWVTQILPQPEQPREQAARR
ncbi:hypothetical protein [uncultured Methanoregula sp.]